MSITFYSVMLVCVVCLQINDLAMICGSNVKENVCRVMSQVLQHGKSGWKSQTEEGVWQSAHQLCH